MIVKLIIGKLPLTKSQTNTNPFEKDQTDVFEIEAMDIGEPTKIKYKEFS
jgi:hypothetical protein